jgi:hypothetical protein
MARLDGWAPVGHRLVDAVPHGQGNPSTFIAGVFRAAINAELFLAYVRQVLAPIAALRRQADATRVAAVA